MNPNSWPSNPLRKYRDLVSQALRAGVETFEANVTELKVKANEKGIHGADEIIDKGAAYARELIHCKNGVAEKLSLTRNAPDTLEVLSIVADALFMNIVPETARNIIIFYLQGFAKNLESSEAEFARICCAHRKAESAARPNRGSQAKGPASHYN